MTTSPYGAGPGGVAVQQISLAAGAMRAKIVTLGASVAELHVLGADMVLGADELLADNPGCMNCVIGRTAGRTAAPGFSLDGVQYPLAGCDGDGGGMDPATNCHAGPDGFDKRNWMIDACSPSSVTLSLVSPDGDQGFPGQLAVSVTYSLEAGGTEFWLRYEATTTKPTPVSLTNHAYFNLSGDGGAGTVYDHTLQLHCSHYNPDDGSGIGLPTGEHRSVIGTARDATASPTSVGKLIEGQAADTPLCA
jgi:aldose 1-epimerase